MLHRGKTAADPPHKNSKPTMTNNPSMQDVMDLATVCAAAGMDDIAVKQYAQDKGIVDQMWDRLEALGLEGDKQVYAMAYYHYAMQTPALHRFAKTFLTKYEAYLVDAENANAVVVAARVFYHMAKPKPKTKAQELSELEVKLGELIFAAECMDLGDMVKPQMEQIETRIVELADKATLDAMKRKLLASNHA
jgi:hypothetical protein